MLSFVHLRGLSFWCWNLNIPVSFSSFVITSFYYFVGIAFKIFVIIMYKKMFCLKLVHIFTVKLLNYLNCMNECESCNQSEKLTRLLTWQQKKKKVLFPLSGFFFYFKRKNLFCIIFLCRSPQANSSSFVSSLARTWILNVQGRKLAWPNKALTVRTHMSLQFSE